MKTRWKSLGLGLMAGGLFSVIVLVVTAEFFQSGETKDGPEKSMTSKTSVNPQHSNEETPDLSGLKPSQASKPSASTPVLSENLPRQKPLLKASEPMTSVAAATLQTPEEIYQSGLEAAYWEVKNLNSGIGIQDGTVVQAGQSTTTRGFQGVPGETTEPVTAEQTDEQQLTFAAGLSIAEKTDSTRQKLIEELDYAVAHPATVSVLLGAGKVAAPPLEVYWLHRWAHNIPSWEPPQTTIQILRSRPSMRSALLLRLIAEDRNVDVVTRRFSVISLRRMMEPSSGGSSIGTFVQDSLDALSAESSEDSDSFKDFVARQKAKL